jgi:hypothetical protein
MRNKLYSILASFILILTILACNLGSGQTNNQPDFAATITAQALALQALNGTTTPIATSMGTNTAQPAGTSLPVSTARPANTPLPSAPSKPKNFKADGSATGISFSWDDNSLNETGFRIYQDGVTAPITSIDAHPATGGMSYNLSGLSCGFKGKFSIRAFSDVGESGSSNSVDAVTIPCQPGNLTAHGQGNDVALNWSVATNHNETGFRIYQQGVSAPVATRGPNLGSGGTFYNLTGVACNLEAAYYVTAFNSAGESPSTNLADYESVPCGPTNFTITSVTKDTVTYTWNDNAKNESGFHVYRDDVLYVTLPAHPGTGSMGNNAAQFCDVNFPVTHLYSVRAFNNTGESNSSEHEGATTPVCP